MTDFTQDATRGHWKNRETWMRGLFMLLFALIFWVAEVLLLATAVFQFGCVLFTARRNDRLLGFGEGLSRWFYEIVAFLTFYTDEKPFPFSDWPGDAGEDRLS